MNLYAWKGENVWELVVGETKEEARDVMELYFEEETQPEELEFVGKVDENQSYYYGHVNRRSNNFVQPCQKLFQDVFGFRYPEKNTNPLGVD